MADISGPLPGSRSNVFEQFVFAFAVVELTSGSKEVS